MKLIIFLMGLFLSQISLADLPYNDLWQQDDKYNFEGISETDFRSVIDEVTQVYKPIAQELGFSLNINGNWEDSTVNAYTSRNGDEWYVAMFGGLARRKEVTRDGFMLVVCHELAHQMGGYPMDDWAAYEGQADYIATHVCSRKVFRKFPKFSYSEIVIPRSCLVWTDKTEQKMCMRNLAAGQSLGNLLAALRNSPLPSYETPDQSVVTETQQAHPAAQCRLDSYRAGTLCTMEWDDTVIPQVSNAVCPTRPKCWFKD